MAVLSKTVEIGLIMKDLASKPIRGVGKSAALALKSVQKLGVIGGAALKGFAFAATGLNQSLELFKKASRSSRCSRRRLENIEARTTN